MTENFLTPESKLTPNAIFVLGKVTGAWLKFKTTHDLKSERLQCCEVTTGLFEALDEWVEVINGLKG